LRLLASAAILADRRRHYAAVSEAASRLTLEARAVNPESPSPVSLSSGADSLTDRETVAPERLTTVRHRTERDAVGRVWRFVYDPAAQDALVPPGMVRIRCTTGTARTPLLVRDDWYDWPRTQLLDELTVALRLGRGQVGGSVGGGARPATPHDDRSIARRRLVRNVRGVAWNCVYDSSPASAASTAASPDAEGLVRVRCTAGRDRLELSLPPGWHRLGDRQLADIIEHALDARTA
jgi:hypothetical protein